VAVHEGVARHQTAIARPRLSKPFQILARHGLINDGCSVFDYGCGRGDDLTVLATAGISAKGWDPYYAADTAFECADVVNLGYVLNVIEEPEERNETLRAAYALARECLCVAVMIAGRADTSGLTPHGDGFLTSRGTFQKYFSSSEAATLIQQATGQEAIPVGPGIFFVFRDKLAEQRFLENRHRRRPDISHLLAIAPPPAAKPPSQEERLLETARPEIEATWRRALELGRLPHPDELDGATAEALSENVGSIRKAAQLAQRLYDPGGLKEARERRVADVTVYFALNLFKQRQRYRELPPELQRDIKAFFGSYSQAESAGRQLLFSLGKPETILETCEEAAAADLGHLFGDHSLQLHTALIERLPPTLRTYIGCAEVLYGDIGPDNADLVKIHIHSGKLTLLRFDDFEGKPLPGLLERIKIKMRELDIDFFDYEDEDDPPCLPFKSQYLASDQEGYAEQAQFDAALAELEVCDPEGYGPRASELHGALAEAGYRIEGFSLRYVSSPAASEPGAK